MSAARVIAIIDVGSNSVRLLVTRALSESAFEVIDEERFDARLGEGNASGRLSEAAMERGLRGMCLMAQAAAAHKPHSTVAVGTEALRRANNAGHLIEAVRVATGLRVRTLSAEEEAYASYLGVINSTGLRDGCIVDIGGGSLEVMTVAERKFLMARSAPLGAIYAKEAYFHSDPPSRKDVRALRKAVRQHLQGLPPQDLLFGVGGAVRNLARILRLRNRYPLRRLHGLTMSSASLHRLAAELTTGDRDARRRIPGLSSARLDSLPAAAVVLDEALTTLGARTLVVSGQGLREGLTWQELRDSSPILPDVRSASIQGLCQANGVDILGAEPVVAAAAALFETTASLHELDDGALQLLLAAVRLAGIGMHIDYYSRDRHAEYLVHSGDLHGFSHREVVLLGELVRCADSGTPDLGAYRALVSPDDARLVAILAPLLGLARAVRRRTPSPILGIDAGLRRGVLELRLEAASPIDAELIAIERQQRRFESALKLRLAVSVGRAAANGAEGGRLQ